jgi:divalent metal cation (Fe/Co/Zn/Cd) transporter
VTSTGRIHRHFDRTLGGPGWEPADDWAALAASGVIAYNGVVILRSALRDLMDATPGVQSLPKLKGRRGCA